jgi:hypothetical protein
MLYIANVSAEDQANESKVDPLCGSSDILSCSAYAKWPGFRDPPRKIYSDRFHGPCAYHDWCYRYGYATYGLTRKACDDQFLSNMSSVCTQVNWSVIATAGISYEGCGLAAYAFYRVVREQAAGAYQQGTLQCKYEGFCPPGIFDTTGFLHGCNCPFGKD